MKAYRRESNMSNNAQITPTGNAIMTIFVSWDQESNMFNAWSDDIPGLATEAEGINDVIARVRDIAPELIELNDIPAGSILAFEPQNIYATLNA